MTTYHLYKWSVVSDNNPWHAPEQRTIQLAGFRDDQPKQIVTSSVVKIEGRNITTRSGSVYVLEDISAEYLDWMQENGITYDPNNPIKDLVKKD